MWKLTIEDDQANRTIVPLARDDYTIGRGEENTVRLTERNISRRHARLTLAAGRWVVFDAGSYNGCYVNGTRVAERHDLAHGDLVQLGDYRLELVDDAIAQEGFDSKATLPVAPRSQTLVGQPDRLVMLVGPTPGAEYPLNSGARQVIGRGEECSISVNHPSVSRVHAEVVSLGDGRYEVVDRESANGVRVNGVELPRGLLDARDVVELGDVIFKFIPAGEIYVPGAEESQQISLGAFEAGGRETRGMTLGTKLALGAGAALVLGTLFFVAAVRSEEPASARIVAVGGPETELRKLLVDAKAAFDHGDVEHAHALANRIPENSNLRDSPDFRAIQATWADSVLAQAGREADAARKRSLLERVARATEVDSLRRKRAANELAAVGGETVDVSDLPSAPPPLVREVKTALSGEDGKVAAAAPVRVPPTATLVRKNPFDETNTAGAVSDLSGADRARLLQAKSQLLAKSRSGAATSAESQALRALCRQLGDASCSN